MQRHSRTLSAFLLAVAAVIVTASAAYAGGPTGPVAPEGPLTDAAALPSTGTLLAAAFETAGYHAQATVLSDLKELLDSLGALVYLGVLMSAIITVALLGNYRAARWILVGPAMFYFAIHPSEGRPAGVEWQFGAFQDTQKDLDRVLAGVQDVSIDGPVARFFHLYNVLISDVYQHLIGIVTDNNIRSQMKFMARQRIMDDLMAVHPDNPGLVALAQFTFAHCHSELGSARLIAMANRDARGRFRNDPQYHGAVADYCHNFSRPNKSFPPGPWQNYVTENFELPPNAPYTRQEFLQRLRDNNMSVSCSQLWFWLMRGATREIREYIRIASNRDIEPYAFRLDPSIPEEILRDIERKITERESQDGVVRQPRVTVDPCPDPLLTAAEARDLERIFASFLIRKVLTEDPRGQMIDQLYDGSGIRLDQRGYLDMLDPGNADRIGRRQRAHEMAVSQQYEAFFLAMTVPYVQGIILYALAAIYPFFALMLILPGQAGAFMTWLALWAWAKSWDVGWALVMVADDVLWELMPHSSYYELTGAGSNVSGQGTYDTPVTVLEGVFSGDHSYTLATYWVLISLMMTGVPLLTAHAIIGSKRAMGGVLIDGLRAFGERLGGAAADWTAINNIQNNEMLRRDFLVRENLSRFDNLLNELDRATQGDALEREFGFRRGEMDTLMDRTGLAATRGGIYLEGLGRQASHAIGNLPNRVASGIDSVLGTSLAGEESPAPDMGDLQARLGRVNEVEGEVARRRRFVNSVWNNVSALPGDVSSGLERFIEGSWQERGRMLRELTDFSNDGPILSRFKLNDGSAQAAIEDRVWSGLHRTLKESFDERTGEELIRYLREIENMRARAEYWRGAAELQAYGGLVMTIAGFGLGAGPLGFGGILMLDSANSSNSIAIDMERRVNEHRVALLSAAMDYSLFDSGNSKEWFFFEQLRAYNSLRGEHWTNLGIPTGAPSDLEARIIGIQNEARRLHGEGLGNILWHARRSLRLEDPSRGS